MDAGRIVEISEPRAFFTDPQHERTRVFLSRWSTERTGQRVGQWIAVRCKRCTSATSPGFSAASSGPSTRRIGRRCGPASPTEILPTTPPSGALPACTLAADRCVEQRRSALDAPELRHDFNLHVEVNEAATAAARCRHVIRRSDPSYRGEGLNYLDCVATTCSGSSRQAVAGDRARIVQHLSGEWRQRKRSHPALRNATRHEERRTNHEVRKNGILGSPASRGFLLLTPDVPSPPLETISRRLPTAGNASPICITVFSA